MNNTLPNKGGAVRTQLSIFSILIFLIAPLGAISSESNEMSKNKSLSSRQQAIIPIASFTADGNLERLKPALSDGLEAGLTLNEIKEIFAHLYAYVGFPRALNGQATFMGVVAERKEQGIQDVEGKEASPVPADFDRNRYGAEVRAKLSGREKDMTGAPWQEFSPIMDTYLKEHLFADIFVRDVLSHQDRELATIAALANMTGTGSQLGFHLGGAMNTGLTKEQLEDFISVFETKVCKASAESAKKILVGVLARRR